jgi:hypothetical protein
VQLPVALVIVIVAESVPPPLHDPDEVIATPRAELALAATGKEPPHPAVAGACVVTRMFCVSITDRAATVSVTLGATPYVAFPAWSK